LFCCDITRVATAPEPRSNFSAGERRDEQKSTIRFPNVFSNLAKTAFLSKEVTSFGWIAVLARLLDLSSEC
jgi:hypothetical protein